MGFRFTFLISAISFFYLSLVFHLYQVQLSSGNYYVARATFQAAAAGHLEAVRGLIYFTDRAGIKTPVATNKNFPVIYAVPKSIDDVAAAAKSVSSVLRLPEDDILKRFLKKSTYELLAKKVSDETAHAAEGLSLKGIYVDDQLFRYYPMGAFASQLVGFVGQSDKDTTDHGKYGLEKMYDSRLAGVSGSIKDGKLKPPTPGTDVVTTLDPNIQADIERVLDDLVKKYDAKGGSAIVEDPKTGKILALANNPTFNPNAYGQASPNTFLNPTTQEIYEPGSVFKVITMSAGIDSGKITPDTTYTDTGSLTVNGRKIQNWDLKAHGLMTMTNVIENSLNTGAAFAERQMGDSIFKKYVAQFGFGETTGIDLPGELSGNLRNISAAKAPPIAFATASFGQGLAVTPIQMINAFAAIANHGVLMRPLISADIVPQEVRHVISAETAAKVTGMMVSAVDKAQIARIKGYALAGKTGTAQLADQNHGGYIPDKYINTYIGFGPVADPRFVILIRLNEPVDAPLAGTTVVPAFRDIAQFLINYWDIPPDRIESDRQ